MEGKMKTAVMLGIGKMGFEERDIPDVKDNEVLVKLEYVGICGSDQHYYETGAIGNYVVKPPFVLGHEPGGTVVEVGKNVTHLKVGDRVALEPGKTCGHCEFCKTGRYNLCPDVVFFATPPVDGVFQEYVAHEANLCFKLPSNVSTLEEKIRQFTDGKGTDLVIETAGTEITTRQAISVSKKGSTIVLVGYSKSGEMTLPMSLALDKELTFRTVFRYRHIYPMAIEAVAQGKVNLKGIVTDIFNLDDVQKAMDYSVNNKADIVKAVIRISGTEN